MTNRTIKMSVLALAVLMLPGVASAQIAEFDLILERTFARPAERVGIDYHAQGGPIFTIASDDRVEVMDSRGNIETIVSGLDTLMSGAVPSENGRFVVIGTRSDVIHRPTGTPYSKYHFVFKKRDGETVYEVPDHPLNDVRVSNDGAVCGTRVIGIGRTTDWRYYDPEGKLTRQFPAFDAVFFGDSGSYFVRYRPNVSAYTRDHALLWSIPVTSYTSGRDSDKVSADGRHYVRCTMEGTKFYRDGELVRIDTTVAGPWNRVIITPDSRHALVVTANRAHLWNLTENTLLRTYDPPSAAVTFGRAASSSDGQWVILSAFTRDKSAPREGSIYLYNTNAEIVWHAEAPREEIRSPSEPWLTMDPKGTYICQMGSTKLWLYQRR